MAKIKPLQTLQHRSLEARATDELRTAIVSRKYALGSRLTEAELAELLGISRGTVRSALQKLLTEGLVFQRPYASWEVVGLSVEDAWELFTLRSALEGLAAELVANGVRQKTISIEPIEAAVETLLAACESSDGKRSDEADFSFHKRVIVSANHGRLRMQYERVEAQIRMLIVAGNVKSRGTMQLVVQHKKLLDALRSGDGDRAGNAFRDHARDTGKKVVERMIEEAGLKRAASSL